MGPRENGGNVVAVIVQHEPRERESDMMGQDGTRWDKMEQERGKTHDKGKRS